MEATTRGALCAVAFAGASFAAMRAGVAAFGWDGPLGGYLFFMHFTFGFYPLVLVLLLWFPLRSRPALRRGYAISAAVIAAIFVLMLVTQSVRFKG